MTMAESIRTSTKWLLAGNLGNSFFNFLFGVILARLLVPEDFGLLVTVQIFTGVASFIAGGGMGQALIRSKEASSHDFNVVFTIQLGICILIYCFFYQLSPYFAHWYHEPIYESLLRVTALNFLLRPIIGNHTAWLQREMHFKARSIIGIVTGIITSIASIIMASLGLGVWSLAISGIIGSIISWALLSSQTPLRPKLAFDRTTARKVSTMGIKFSSLDIVSYLRSQANNFIIGRMAGAAPVGLFNKAESLAQLPFTTISSSVYQPVFRTLAIEQDNIDKSKYIFLRTFTLLLAYTLPAYIALSLLAKPFITVVYGPKWIEAASPLSIMALAWMFSSFAHPAGALLAAQNRLRQELVVQTVALIINSIAVTLGLRWGLTGAAWGLLAARLYSLTHMSWLVSQCIPLRGKDIISAIKPGLSLGINTFLAISFVSILTPTDLIVQHEVLFLALSLIAGGLAFLFTLLFFPMPEITSESDRWRKILHFSKIHDA